MKLVSKLALATALAVPTLAMAESPNTGGLTFWGAVDVASNYYFRGYLIENEGLIIQPSFGVTTNLHKTDDFSVGLALSTWNSIHTEHGDNAETAPSDGGGAGAWFENDIYVEVPISFGKFVVTPLYYLYQYPGGAFETVQEFGIKAQFDDSGMWGDMGDWANGLSFKPYAAAYLETEDDNGTEDGYFEVGIAPGYTFNKGGDYEMPLSFPITLGGSFDDYFTDSDGDNEVFGYVQVGVTTSIPLSFMDSKFGVWNLNVGGFYQNLFADSLEAANNDSSHAFWGKIGISFVY